MAKIVCETSARHLHVTQEALETLFGEGYELNPKKMLSQPGQFVCNEKVRVIGPKGEFPGVSIIGPCRSAVQVEISLTDARSIGLTVPVRESGDVAGSAGCKLVGPKGELEISEGVICAQRHIHLTPKDAEEIGVKNGQLVSVRVNGTRPVIFCDTVVRVSEKYAPAFHIDTDESNAAGVGGNVEGEILL